MNIDHFERGQITVAGKKYNNDIIIGSEKIIDNWRRKRGHHLAMEDISPYKEMILNAGYLLCGCGIHEKMKINNEVLEWIKLNDLIFFHGATDNICSLYNEAVSRGQRPVALLHLTC